MIPYETQEDSQCKGGIQVVIKIEVRCANNLNEKLREIGIHETPV